MNETKTKAGSERRASLREKLLDAAEQTVIERGLTAVKARDLATQVGCALGAIYTAFQDLDELVLRVNMRTLGRLETALAEALGTAAPGAALLAMARTYLNFARRNEPSWRALFEHRLPPGVAVPDWYVEARERLFGRLEAPLAELLPQVDAVQRARLARTLFSSVHGVVALGLEQKIADTPAEVLDEELEKLVRLIEGGLAAGVLR